MDDRVAAASLVVQLRKGKVPMVMIYAALLLSFNSKVSLTQECHQLLVWLFISPEHMCCLPNWKHVLLGFPLLKCMCMLFPSCSDFEDLHVAEFFSGDARLSAAARMAGLKVVSVWNSDVLI